MHYEIICSWFQALGLHCTYRNHAASFSLSRSFFLSQGHSSPLLTPDIIYILSNTAISTPNKKEALKESINLSLPET